jgi:hypothetical protein
MADVPTTPGGTINVPTDDLGTPSTLAMLTIARRAMRVIGTQTDAAVTKTALECIQDAVNDANIRNKFDWTIGVDTDVTLVEGQREYDIPSSAFTLKELVLVDFAESPERILPLGYLDWDQLQRFYIQSSTGHPVYWSARDVFMNRKVELAVAPDAATASKYRLRIYYHKAIVSPPVNDPSVQISAPAVVSTVIQRYVEYRLLMIYGEPNDGRRRDIYREYRDLLNQLKGMENRSRPGADRFIMPGVRQNSSGFSGRGRWPGPHRG